MTQVDKTRLVGQPPVRMAPSDPVVIPARRSVAIRREAMTLRSTTRDDSSRGRTTSRRQTPPQAHHRPDGIPPAVAALLAVTSIPPPKKNNVTLARKSNATMSDRRTSRSMSTIVFDEKDAHAHDDGVGLHSKLSRSPLEILLSPAEELEDDEFSETSSPTPPPAGSQFFDSSPSVDVDDGSQTSLSAPPSPGSEERRGLSAPRKEKPVSSPPAQDCLLDHPLLSQYAPRTDSSSAAHQDAIGGGARVSRSARPAPIPRPSSFRSNLTASLRVLRSAAKSFSTFTAGPTIQADDFLTRSILSISPQFTDERWPLATPLEDTPTPALRRYFNPPSVTSATNDGQAGSLFEMRRHHRASVCHDDQPWTGAIQLQTYRTVMAAPPTSGSSSSSTSRVGFPGQGRQSADRSHPSLIPSSPLSPAIQGPVARNREPRENSNFLRVIVLEMNMRREGKLSDSSPGKARFVLPPRQKLPSSDMTCMEDPNDDLASSSLIYGPGKRGTGAATGRTTEVPRRWVGVVA